MKFKNKRRLAATADLHCKQKSHEAISDLLSAMANDADILWNERMTPGRQSTRDEQK